MLATITSAPELNLSETEAHQLAKNVQEVQSHYDSIMDPKTEAWLGLGLTVAIIYGPRIYALNARMNKEASENTIDATAKPAPGPQPQPQPQPGAAKKPSRDGRKDSGPVTPSDIFPPDQRGG